MPEPCRSCEERTKDYGGCRCQAYLLTGDMGATDPVCDKSPQHDVVLAAIEKSDKVAERALLFRSPENSRIVIDASRARER